MLAPVVEVKNLSKSFKLKPHRDGWLGWLRRGRSRQVRALANVSFSLKPGQIVGIVGPNGAGKTTLLKILTGILEPDRGEVKVLSSYPFRRELRFLSRIGFLMGNRNHLWWNLPAIESFKMLQVIYQIPKNRFDLTLKRLLDLIEIGDYYKTKPVRELSLGERMRCQLAAVFLHQPELVFLDEPTLGLDIVVQDKVRQFILGYQKEFGSTIILTSHYLKDIESLSDEILIINQGRLIFAGDQTQLRQQVKAEVQIRIETKITSKKAVSEFLDQLNLKSYTYRLSLPEIILIVPSDQSVKVSRQVVDKLRPLSLEIKPPDMEMIIKRYFNSTN